MEISTLGVFVYVFLMLALLVFQGGAQLQSSVGTNALCPGERVTLTCNVSSNLHDWRIINSSTDQEIGVLTPTNPSRTNLGFELTVVDVTASPITSTATVTTSTDLNGTVIVCNNGLLPPNRVEQSTTVNIIGAPTAPGITMLSESSRTVDNITIRANLQRAVYGFECIQNYTIIARADGEEDVRGVSTSPDLFVLVPGLSVCPRQYTFTALACSPGLPCSSEGAPETLNVTDGLLPVTNIENDIGTLGWNQPQNTPPGCITGYTIAWDDGMFTTPDDRTSIPIDNVQGLEFCRTYTSISVTPIVPLFGAIQSSISELLNVVLLLPDFPTPSSLLVEMFVYNASGIVVQLDWSVTSQNPTTTANISIGYSRTMDTCSRSSPGVQHIPDPDISTTAKVLLDDSFVGETSSFCVFYTFNDCGMRSDTNTSFPSVITNATASGSTATSASATINYNTSVTIEAVADFTVRLSIIPNISTEPQELLFPGPQLISLSGLRAGTSYTGTVQVVSTRGVTIGSAVINFITDAEVGIPFWAWVAVGVAGVALAGGVGGVGGVGVGITILYMRKKSKKKNDLREQAGPYYSEVAPGQLPAEVNKPRMPRMPTDVELDMKTNIAYETIKVFTDTRLEMKHNIAYESVRH